MYCSNCGNKVPDDAKRCPECGEDLSYESSTKHSNPRINHPNKGRKAALLIVLVVLVLAGIEAMWFLLPDKSASSSAVSANQAAGTNHAAVTNLISEDEQAESAASSSEDTIIPSVEPTPTPTVTPIANLPEIKASTVATPTPTPTPTPKATPTATPTPTPTPTTSPTPTPTKAANDGYIMASTATKLLTEAELKKMDAAKLRLVRNEIYARHGLIFKSADLKAYFEAKSWYKGTVTDPDSCDLNDIEKQNVDLITAYEAKNNLNQ